ncbi:hypothetical protein OUY_02565 [Wolbachia endosymbiont of Leptopilina clavipes]|uniref:hypothetical protein n=1 Tax=Wolbachia endosymbiont of Leptopilina clavipes TaxID=260213 RepID=UPI001118DEDE|nr:hypothetical protein [Wolbachia endosymbiont of Leptopilina clavipes]TNK94219.1 hypothetical protein OUY_02565 [Wolbachia endosymbiont of Leptopilina clavipes]
MASLTFKDSAGANIVSPTIKSIIYEDAAQNKYTFGVDNTSVFNTFRYEPNGAAEIDYSATATNFMTGGAIATLLGIGTNVGAIKTKTDSIPADLSADLVTIKTQVGTDLISGIKAKTDKITDTLGADVIAIKAKTDTIPADLTAKVTSIETATNAANLGNKVTAIQTKTDKIPADLNAELIKLTTIAKTLNGAPQAAAAAKAVLESSFKKAIEEAGEDGSEWLKNEIKEIVSQPSFEIPTDSSSPLSWDW